MWDFLCDREIYYFVVWLWFNAMFQFIYPLELFGVQKNIKNYKHDSKKKRIISMIRNRVCHGLFGDRLVMTKSKNG
jgi:hypothetical protein